MVRSTPLLDSAALKKGLHTKKFGQKIFTFETIDSTNNCAKALAGCWAEEGTVVLAEEQTEGRGRLGRSWQARPNENLTFSLILRPDLPAEAMNLLPLYAAVAVAEAVEKTTGIAVECKWPNDLLIQSKKAAGILLEGSLKEEAVEYVIIGIGLNVNQTTFPPELADRATSLRLASGREVERAGLFRAILQSLESHYLTIMKQGFHVILPLWLSRTRMINKQITLSHDGATLSGVVTGLSPEGALIVKTNGAEKTLYAGDVSIVEM